MSIGERDPLDAKAILRELTAAGVDFVVIGGIALVLHGSARFTFDLDLTYSTDPANLEGLGGVLVALESRLRGVDDDVPFVADAATLRNIEVLTLRTSAGDLDVLAHPAGAPSYKVLRGRAERVDIGGFAVLVASIGDLIAMKTAAGRTQDLLDVEELEAIARLRKRREPPPPGSHGP